MDTIRNEHIRKHLGVMNIAGKMRKNRLKRFGHIERRVIIMQSKRYVK